MPENNEQNNTIEPEVSEINVNDIIKQHVTYSMILGALPVPILDIVGVTGVQVDMLKQIADAYSVDFNKESGKSLVTSLIAATFARVGAGTIARMGASAVKTIPGIGTVIGIGSQAILSGASTYALGKAFEEHFKNKEDIFSVDMEYLRKKYTNFFKEGKKMARNLNKESNENILETIDKLNDLKEKGAISADEYETLKNKLINKI